MSGDNAPSKILRGVLCAVEETDVHFTLLEIRVKLQESLKK